MMHPATELRRVDARVGFGVFATERIPRGTITWARCALDQGFAPERFADFGPPYRELLDKYAYLDGNGEYLLCWDHGRFVNHSCDPTCLSAGWADFEIAVRDIEPGEEVTDEYGSLNVGGGFDCLCGSPVCRKRILADDLVRHAPRWDAMLATAFPDMSRVPQPLWEIVRSRADVQKALRGETPVPSILLNYRPRKL